MPVRDDEEAGVASVAANSSSPPTHPAITGAAAPERPGQQQRVLTPAGLRLDSRVLWLHTSFVWTTNCVFCVFLMYKLNETWRRVSWWVIFSPLFLGHALHIPLLVWVLCTVKQRMLQQLGPPPPRRASLALHAQFTALRAVHVRSHLVDNTNALLDSVAMLIVKIQFAYLLNNGEFHGTSLRVVFAPIWAVWVVTLLLVCTKHRRERVVGSQRDFTYVFLLMVAFKVDGESSFPWPVVFVVPWIWLCVVLLLGVVVAVSLSCARGWTRLKELMMPVGFMLLLFSTGMPMFAMCRNLVARLEGDTSVTYEAILIPAAVGWAAMWLSSGVLAYGLRSRERARAILLASGAVWTAHEALARGLQPAALREEEQRRVDAMPEEEVVALAQSYMRTRDTPIPHALMRVGPSLYKRVPQVLISQEGTTTNTITTTTATSSVTATKQDSSQNVKPPPSSPLGTQGDARVDQVELMESGGEMTVGGSSGMDGVSASGRARVGDGHQEGVGPGSHTGRKAMGSGTQASTAMSASGVGRAHGVGSSSQRQGGATGASGGVEMMGMGDRVDRVSGSVGPGQGQAASRGSMGGDHLIPALLQPTTGIAALLGMREAEDGGLQAGAAGGPMMRGDDVDDGTCVICFDGQATCVLLDCGHGGLCRRCAHLLLVRPPNQCPSCRQQIELVVQLEQVQGVGMVCAVKQQ